MSDSRLYWIGFNLVKGIGAVRFRALLDVFGDAESAWKAPADALRSAGLSARIIENLVKVRAQVSLEQLWNQIQAEKIQVITWDDENYPRRLKEIDQPPPVIYARGELLAEDEWAVAIVGTRRITSYGRQVSEEVASTLARNGVTVVSGLARGVDGVAHQSALNAGGRTLAVLGSGVNRVYPPEHRRLAEQIIARGALISDYPPGTPPDAGNFPPRNRIISGLSMAVVVVEAGAESGALITASFAAEQGREVFAVPGNIMAPQSQGTNRLVQQGAHPLLDMKELLDILDLTRVSEHKTARAALPADETEARLLKVMSGEPKHVDEIRSQTGMPIEKVSATLAMMELKGMVRQVGGMQYVTVREEGAVYNAGEGG
ncbi:MAG: DNA-protecting protein DprA [Chloroflexota bacterium]|nr:MAG: DNA-protecting protein DprA [Chloroflexota bacterium]